MELFKKKKEPQESVEPKEDLKEIKYGSDTTEQDERLDEDSARTRFKILIRMLNDVETQLKTKKPTDEDPIKRDKIPTENSMINKAELIKLELQNLISGFIKIGYNNSGLEELKREALNKTEGYIYVTL
jgi:hypothetical protein